MARKILLADDSVTAQNMGRKILADAGYEVITVNNGSAALKRISEQRPDVIVLDVYMPGYSGLEVCQRLKEVGETARIPILLTVGKLEPFKPEEVKRVRADAFIVKPFEASELLSALSKLEDRIVPRAEASKPGRFARAAMEQVPYDKTMAIEEDTTWKNRIAFPSKKKAKEPEPDEPVETQASKDLQSVIEKKMAEVPATSAENDRVDLGALAPAGLPKDVTPEEIAALAAAAAQMQGRIADGRYVSPAPNAEPPKIEVKEEPKPIEAPKVEAVASPLAAETVTEAKPVEQVEAKEAEAPAPASFADQILGSAQAERPSDESSATSGNGSSPHHVFEPPSDEPITMAVATVAESKVHASRWTAVAVAPGPEEAAISLEQEMQKAYADLAKADSRSSDAGSKSEPTGQSSSAVESAQPVMPVPVIASLEAVQSLTASASAAKEAVPAVTEKFEAAAASNLAEKEAPATLDSMVPDAPVRSFEVAAVPVATGTDPKSALADSASKEEVATTAGDSAEAVEQLDHLKAAEHSAAPSVPKEPTPEAPQSTVDVPQQKTGEPSHQLPDLAALAAAALTELQSSGAEHSSQPKIATQDTAAKAVAVGAESRPEDVTPSESDSDSVASIVDSVLADLRPKIVAEISKKLGKKK